MMTIFRLVEEGFSLFVVFVLHCGHDAKGKTAIESSKPRRPLETKWTWRRIYLWTKLGGGATKIHGPYPQMVGAII
jgi:hypothetical protein